jgi:hypothetical protein
MANQWCNVRRWPGLVESRQEGIEGRPAPVEVGTDAATKLAQLVGALRIGRQRRRRKAAQADDFGRHALTDRVRRRRKRGQREVGVRVQVDESRCQRQPASLDRSIAGAQRPTDSMRSPTTRHRSGDQVRPTVNTVVPRISVLEAALILPRTRTGQVALRAAEPGRARRRPTRQSARGRTASSSMKPRFRDTSRAAWSCVARAARRYRRDVLRRRLDGGMSASGIALLHPREDLGSLERCRSKASRSSRRATQPGAFEALVQRHQTTIYSFCWRLLGQADGAADVTPRRRLRPAQATSIRSTPTNRSRRGCSASHATAASI